VAETVDLAEVKRSKAFLSSFGVRLTEIGVTADDDWEEEALNALWMPHSRVPPPADHLGGDGSAASEDFADDEGTGVDEAGGSEFEMPAPKKRRR
jgi:hypothetical protein